VRYDERMAEVLSYLRASKHGLLLGELLAKLFLVYPDSYASAYRMLRRDIRQFNTGIGRSIGCSISVTNRPAQCRLKWEG
jgi:hypothetical protein